VFSILLIGKTLKQQFYEGLFLKRKLALAISPVIIFPLAAVVIELSNLQDIEYIMALKYALNKTR